MNLRGASWVTEPVVGSSFAILGWFTGGELTTFAVAAQAPKLECDPVEAVCFPLRTGVSESSG